LKRLSAKGDSLEELARIEEFEGLSVILESALADVKRSKGGPPSYDCVAMLKIFILAAQNNLA
jgi:IS5 family transposase